MTDSTQPVPEFPADLTLDAYGVVLTRMTEDDLEMVRAWRTDPEVSRFMIYRDPITPEMQRRWFASLDPSRDLHFVVHSEGAPCGLSDVKSIDWTARTFVGGIFLAPAYWNSDIAVRVALCASDFGFGELGLEASVCRVLVSNTRAVRFNLSLGYAIEAGDTDAEYYDMRLARADYERATRRLKAYLDKAAATDDGRESASREKG